MDCSLPGSSVHGIFQARVLEWGATAFSTPNIRVYQNKSHLITQEKVQEGVDMYIYGWFMLMYGRNQHNIVMQLSSIKD